MGKPLAATRWQTVDQTAVRAHAGQSQLIDWVGHFESRPVLYLVHGELSKSEALANAISDRLDWEAHIPEQGEHIAF